MNIGLTRELLLPKNVTFEGLRSYSNTLSIFTLNLLFPILDQMHVKDFLFAKKTPLFTISNLTLLLAVVL